MPGAFGRAMRWWTFGLVGLSVLAPMAVCAGVVGVKMLAATWYERLTRPDALAAPEGVVQFSGRWSLWRHFTSVQTWVEWDARFGFFARLSWEFGRTSWLDMARYAGGVAVLVVIAYGGAWSWQARRNRLFRSDRLLSADDVLPPWGGALRALRRSFIATVAMLSVWYLLSHSAYWLQLLVWSKDESIRRALHAPLSAFDDWWQQTRAEACVVIGVLGVLGTCVGMARLAAALALRARGRCCATCGYPVFNGGSVSGSVMGTGPRGAGGGVCPECGTPSTTSKARARRRCVRARWRRRCTRMSLALIVLAGALFFVESGVMFELARVRYSPGWLRTFDGASEEQVRLTQLKYGVRGVALVRTGTWYRVTSGGAEGRVRFEDVPGRSTSATFQRDPGPDEEHRFEYSSEVGWVPGMPLVTFGPATLLLTPRQDYGLADDLPPGWIAVRIYDADVQFHASPTP